MQFYRKNTAALLTFPAIFDVSAIPEKMQSAPRWLLHRDKKPFYIDGRPRQGKLDGHEDLAALGTLDQALDAMATGRYTGLGFALGPDGTGACWQGIDLDHVDERPDLAALGETLPGYVEKSPSGKGLHAIGYGKPFASLGSNSTGIEAYAKGRYFTFTGEAIGGEIEDLSAFVDGILTPLHSPVKPDREPRPDPGRYRETGAVFAVADAVLIDDLRSALAFLPSDDRDQWIKIGLALYPLGDTGRSLWFEWSAKSEKFNDRDARRVWHSFRRTQGPDGRRAIFAAAQDMGWINPARARAALNKEPSARWEPPPEPEPTIDSEPTQDPTQDPTAKVPKWLKDDVKRLAELTGEEARKAARSIVAAHAWRCPWQLTPGALAMAVAAANKAIDGVRLSRFAVWLDRQWQAQTTPRPLKDARHIAAPADALATIQREGGIHFIRAPHGSGKTHHVLTPLALGCRSVVAVSNRVALVSDLSVRLSLDSYQTVAPESQRPRLAICINSVTNGAFGHLLNAETLLIDEGARTAREIHSRSGTMGADAPYVWHKLRDMAASAKTVVIVDADLTDADIALYREILPGRQVTVWQVSEKPREKVAIFGTGTQAIARIEAALKDGQRVLVACESAAMVETLAAALRQRHNGRKIVAVTQETSGRPEIKALLADVNGELERQQIDCVIHSPAIESGVSIQRPQGSPFDARHFTCHVGIYSGITDPLGFNQALARDRDATNVFIGIRPGPRDLLTDPAAILNALDATARLTETLSNGSITIKPATAYDRHVCEIEAESNLAKSRHAASLWHLLRARGWTCQRAGEVTKDETKAAREVLQTGREIADLDHCIRILTAPDLPRAIVATMRQAHQPDPDALAAIDRSDIKLLFGIAGALEPVHVALWQRGRITGQLRMYKLLSSALFARDGVQADDTPLSLSRFDLATGAALRKLLSAAGIDIGAGWSGSITAASAMDAYRELAGTDHGAALSVARVASFAREPARPVAWLSRILAQLGGSLECVAHIGRAGVNGRVYRVFSETEPNHIATGISYLANGRVKAPGVAVMEALLRRVTVDIDGLAATVTGTTEGALRRAIAYLNEIEEYDTDARAEYLRSVYRTPDREPLAMAA